jgi:hypothetical protein
MSWYQASCGLFLAAAALAGVGVRCVVHSSAHSPPGEPRPGGRPRWVLVAILLAAAGAMVFLPW